MRDAELGVSFPDGDSGPGPREGFGLLLVCWALFQATGISLGALGVPPAGLVLALQAGAILLPTVLWSLWRRCFGIAFPWSGLSGRGAGAILVLGSAGSLASLGAGGLIGRLWGTHAEQRAIEEILGGFTPAGRFFLLALLPAVCEEALFRGAFLACLSRWHPLLAASSSAVAFGLFHGSLARAVPASLLGFCLALAVRRTGHLPSAMAVHAAHNGAVLVLAAALAEEEVPLGLCGVLLFGGILLGIVGLRTGGRAQRMGLEGMRDEV